MNMIVRMTSVVVFEATHAERFVQFVRLDGVCPSYSSMGLQISSNVKVFRLQEPERGQTTLD